MSLNDSAGTQNVLAPLADLNLLAGESVTVVEGFTYGVNSDGHSYAQITTSDGDVLNASVEFNGDDNRDVALNIGSDALYPAPNFNEMENTPACIEFDASGGADWLTL